MQTETVEHSCSQSKSTGSRRAIVRREKGNYKTMKKKILSIVLVLSLLVSALSISALAVDSGYESRVEAPTLAFMADADISIKNGAVIAQRTVQTDTGTYETTGYIFLPGASESAQDIYNAAIEFKKIPMTRNSDSHPFKRGAVTVRIQVNYITNNATWGSHPTAYRLTSGSMQITNIEDGASIIRHSITYCTTGEIWNQPGQREEDQQKTFNLSASATSHSYQPTTWAIYTVPIPSYDLHVGVLYEFTYLVNDTGYTRTADMLLGESYLP